MSQGGQVCTISTNDGKIEGTGSFDVYKSIERNFPKLYGRCEMTDEKEEKEDDTMKIKETKKLTLEEFKEFETDREITECKIKINEEKVDEVIENYGLDFHRVAYYISDETVEFKEKAVVVTGCGERDVIPYSIIEYVEITTLK